MPTMSTGFVRAAGYADKVRRVMFAKAKGVDPKEIVRASAEFNQKIFDMLQEKGVKKEDVVRIKCDFDIQNGQIVWNYDTLQLEVYSKEEKPLLSEAMGEVEAVRELLDEDVRQLSELAKQLAEVSDKLNQLIEKIRREYTSVRGKEDEAREK
ncbi:MAG: single- stranded DNA-binding family protein [Candidatus Asgardarchaeia archaeon]